MGQAWFHLGEVMFLFDFSADGSHSHFLKSWFWYGQELKFGQERKQQSSASVGLRKRILAVVESGLSSWDKERREQTVWEVIQWDRFVRISLSYLKSQLFNPHDFTQIRGKWGCGGQSSGKALVTVKERRERRRVWIFPEQWWCEMKAR